MATKKTEICGIFNYAEAIKQSDLSKHTINILSHAQANLINDNVYVKSEIDMSIQQMLHDSNLRFKETLAEFNRSDAKRELARIEDNARHEKAMLQIENRFEKAINKAINDASYRVIKVLSSIVILTGAVASLWHHFV